MSTPSFQLVDPTGQLLREIADAKLRQIDVAQTMALARQFGQEVDVAKVSAAAIERWGVKGWRRIKTLAWTGKCWPKETP